MFEIFKDVLIGHIIYRAQNTIRKDPSFTEHFFHEIKLLYNKNIELPQDIKKKKEWFFCNFNLMDEIKKCKSLKSFKKKLAIISPEKIIFKIIKNNLKLLLSSDKNKQKYKDRILKNLQLIEYPIRLKIFRLPYARIEKKEARLKIYFLGLPLIKKIHSNNKDIFYVFGIPLITHSKCFTKFLGITIANRTDTYLQTTFDYLGWKINDVYQKNFDYIGYQLNEVIPNQFKELKDLNNIYQKDFDYIGYQLNEIIPKQLENLKNLLERKRKNDKKI